MSDLRDFLQGASNSAASNLSAPVDGIAWLLRKAGLPIHDAPIGGSDWMAQKGLTAVPQNQNMGLLGEAAGGVTGLLGVAKAPQIARGLLQIGENVSTPSTMAMQGQRGMALFDTTGLPNRGRDLIRSSAEDLADKLKSQGFQVDVQHSGSAAGPSSYLKVFDPQTGRYFDNVRFSGHPKGAFNSSGVTNVATPEEFQGVIDTALNMRAMGPVPNVEFRPLQQVSDLENSASKARPMVFDAFKQARDSAVDFSKYRAK